MVIVVADHESWVEKDGDVVARLENEMAWIAREDGGKMIIAVGGRHQWGSSQPLPSEAVLTDLVRASTSDPGLAALLWGPFLRYLFHYSKPPWWRVANPWLRISVRVAVTDSDTYSAVKKSIAASGRSVRVVARDTAS